VLFDRQADVIDGWRQAQTGYSYGLYSTPTAMELAAPIAQLEGALHSFVVPGGQAAIALIYLTYCQTGGHALVPFSVYLPNNALAHGLLKALGIKVEGYDPLIGGGIAALMRPNTSLSGLRAPARQRSKFRTCRPFVQPPMSAGC